MTQADTKDTAKSLPDRLRASAETLRVYGHFTTDYSPVSMAQLLLQAAHAIEALEGKLGVGKPVEGSSRALLRT